MNETYPSMDTTESSHELHSILPLPFSASSESKPLPSPKRRKTRPDPRALRPGQAGVAWERLKRVVRDHCQHPGHELLAFSIYGGSIEFQTATDGPVVTLIREDNQILKCMGGTEETIRIVGLKTKGVGFEWRRHRYTATRVIIEILHEARMISEGLTKTEAPEVLATPNGRRQRRSTKTA